MRQVLEPRIHEQPTQEPQQIQVTHEVAEEEVEDEVESHQHPPPTVSTTPTVPTTPSVSPSPACTPIILNIIDPRLQVYARELGIIGASNISRQLTRAEFLSITFRAAGIEIPESTTGTSTYADVTSSTTETLFSRTIAYATELGIVSG